MKEPLVSATALLSAQDNADSQRQADAWNILPLVHDHDSAEGLMQIVAELQQGRCIHFVTDGAWSLHELVIALTEVTGPANMYFSSYAISETACRTFTQLLSAGMIKSIQCVIDNRTDTRKASSLQLLTSISDRCKLAACHAKVTVLEGANHSVLIMGSANYTENARLETGIVLMDKAACAFHKKWITDKTLEQ